MEDSFKENTHKRLSTTQNQHVSSSAQSQRETVSVEKDVKQTHRLKWDSTTGAQISSTV